MCPSADTPTPSPDAPIEELLGCLQYARLAATWLRNHADRAHKYDRGYIEEVGKQIAQAEVAADDLASHLRAAMAENVCDACAGTGKPTSGLTCMCGGTGKMSVAAPVLREIAVQANARADSALSEIEAMRANWASAVNDIAAFLESCDDSRDDPLAYAAGEVRRRWGSALDARGKHQPKETG